MEYENDFQRFHAVVQDAMSRALVNALKEISLDEIEWESLAPLYDAFKKEAFRLNEGGDAKDVIWPEPPDEAPELSFKAIWWLGDDSVASEIVTLSDLLLHEGTARAQAYIDAAERSIAIVKARLEPRGDRL